MMPTSRNKKWRIVLAGSGFSMVSAPLRAEEAGVLELQAIVNLFFTPFGFAVGLLVTAFGVWQLVVSQNVKRGIILIILGVVVTGFPVLFKGLRSDLYAVPAAMGGSGEAADFTPYLPPVR